MAGPTGGAAIISGFGARRRAYRRPPKPEMMAAAPVGPAIGAPPLRHRVEAASPPALVVHRFFSTAPRPFPKRLPCLGGVQAALR